MKKFFEEFKKFITRGNVVDMAIGVAVAGAFTKIVNAFTNGFVSPIVGLITGGASLAEQKWILRKAVTETVDGVEKITTPEVAFLWGNFVQMIVDFLIIAFVLFIVMKTFNKISAKAKGVNSDIKDNLKPKKIKEAEAEAAKAAAEKKAAEEAAAKAKAEEEAAKAEAEKQAQLAAYAAQVAVAENTEKLLTEIRDLLKKEQNPEQVQEEAKEEAKEEPKEEK